MKSKGGKRCKYLGGKVIAFLGILTISSTVSGHNVLHMPPILDDVWIRDVEHGYFETKYPNIDSSIFCITGDRMGYSFILLWNISCCRRSCISGIYN